MYVYVSVHMANEKCPLFCLFFHPFPINPPHHGTTTTTTNTGADAL